MSEKKLKFAIFGNEYQAKKSASIQKILSSLSQYDAEMVIDRSFYDFLKAEKIDVKNAPSFEGDDFDADFVISMGGDGTFLKAAARVGRKQIPILGVNMGRLGFLSDILPSEIDKTFEAIYDDGYRIESHSVVMLEADGVEFEECPFALNDIAVLKRDNASMISIHTSVDDEYMVTYQADGLIISTPTGSTAYGLSNGGPIMVPNTDILCLTPVAPHSLNIRPVVVSGESVVKLTVESRSHNFLVAIDGRSVTMKEGTKLSISKAPYEVKIVKLPNKRYYSTLREKMMWGADSRNR